MIVMNTERTSCHGIYEHNGIFRGLHFSHSLNFIHKYLQSITVIIYISIIQTGFRRRSEDLFESVPLTCVRQDIVIMFVFMQYANNI